MIPWKDDTTNAFKTGAVLTLLNSAHGDRNKPLSSTIDQEELEEHHSPLYKKYIRVLYSLYRSDALLS